MTKRIFQSGGGGKKGYGGFPVSEFIALTDAPHAYTGAAAKFVTVKAGENGLEFTPLPPLAITDTFVVNSQAEMLALVAQTGDVAIRTDINQSFILSGTGDPTILANWYMLLVSPTHAIGGALHTADTLAHLKSKLSAPDTLISSDAGEIAAFTEKTPAIAADLLVIEDSADGNKKKKIQIGNLPAAAPAAHAIGGALHTADTLAHLKSKLSAPDTLISSDAGEIAAFTEKTPAIAADLLVIEDSADGNKKKKIQIGNLPAGIVSVGNVVCRSTSFSPSITTVSNVFADMMTGVNFNFSGRTCLVLIQGNYSDNFGSCEWNKTEFGFRWDNAGTEYLLCYAASNLSATHLPFSGFRVITPPSSGNHILTPRWRRVAGAGIITIDSNDMMDFSYIELN